MEEVEKALRFDGGRWSVLGNVDDVKRSDGRRKIIEALGNYGSKQSPKEIAEGTGMKVNNVNRLLLKMVKAGEVVKDGYGTYSVPTHQSGQTDQSPSTQYLGKYFDAEMPDAQVELARSLDLERLRGALGYQGGSDPGHGVDRQYLGGDRGGSGIQRSIRHEDSGKSDPGGGRRIECGC